MKTMKINHIQDLPKELLKSRKDQRKCSIDLTSAAGEIITSALEYYKGKDKAK